MAKENKKSALVILDNDKNILFKTYAIALSEGENINEGERN